jgi:hypothetical protein
MIIKQGLKNINSKFPILQEAFVLILLILVVNCFFERREVFVAADGKGYFDYLPAAFIYRDLNFTYLDTLVTEFYDHRVYNQGINPEVNGHRINKYFAGTAVVQIPFFLLAHGYSVLSERYIADGYGTVYQQFVKYAAWFYLFLGLVFLRKLLQKRGVPNIWVFVLQVVIVFGSSLMQYAYADASFSHVYSFFFITFFVYCINSFATNEQKKYLYLAGLSFGFIVLIRPVNGLIMLFIPFLFENQGHLFRTARLLFTNYLQTTLIALTLGLLIIAIQPLVWYIQTGLFFVDSYQDETFILTQPNILKFLFSYQKGFIVYAPAFFLMLIGGSLVYIQQRNFWKLGAFYLAFFVLVYIISSWWDWKYGSSFGSRVMVDYYSLFVLFVNPFFKIRQTRFKALYTLLFLPLCFISIVQTYQYQTFILHDSQMTKEKYWRVFLKTQPRYRGLLYLNKVELHDEKLFFQRSIFNHEKPVSFIVGYNLLDSLDGNMLLKLASEMKQVVMQIDLNVSYLHGNDEMLVVINDTLGNNRYYHSIHLLKAGGKENFSGWGQLQYIINSHLLENAIVKVYFIRKDYETVIEELKIQIASIDKF